jgi:hypothetical protein
MATIHEIVRCLKLDYDGDLLAGARYAERISANAALNPWAPAEDAGHYAEAAKILTNEYEKPLHRHLY